MLPYWLIGTLFLVSCAHGPVPAKRTMVTVIGSYHHSLKKMKNYSPAVLTELIAKSSPQVIATEIRPEDFAKGDTSHNPWDVNEVVLPYAARKSIEVIPIDWWPNDMRSKQDAFFRQLKKSSAGRRILEEVDDEWRPHQSSVANFYDATPEYVHSELFAERETEFRQRVAALVGEGPQNLMWLERAGHMNRYLARALQLHPGQRITVVVGAAHRPDIERFLRTLAGVEIRSPFP